MRVTLLGVGSRGDVQPLIALGRGLSDAGHEVLLATHPRFEGGVAAQGLAFAPLAEGHLSRGAETAAGREWIDTGSKRLPTWVGFLRDARSVASRRLRDAVAACGDADAIVASNLAFVLGWQISTDRGLPLVRAFLEPPAWMFTKRRALQRVAPAIRQLAWLCARPWFNRVRRTSLGLGPLPWREPMADLDRRRLPVLYAFSAAIAPAPALQSTGLLTGYWILEDTIDPDPPVALVEFLADGPPPVLITFSTMIDDDPAARAQLAIDALGRAGVRGVLQLPADQLADASLPPDIFAVGEISHEWLFPRCALLVHHAAVGTTAAGLRAGVPAVTIPHMTDQFFWARRLHELGVSPPPIPRRELTAPRLADVIRSAASDQQMRLRARTLSAAVRGEDGVGRAVEAFERLVVHPVGRQARPRAKHVEALGKA